MFDEQFVQTFAERIITLLVPRLPKPGIAPRYLTVAQAAQYVGHTKRSFEYMMSKDLFPVIRRDRLVLIDREDLDRFMLNHKC